MESEPIFLYTSPYTVAQRQRLNRICGEAVQRKGGPKEEKLLQGISREYARAGKAGKVSPHRELWATVRGVWSEICDFASETNPVERLCAFGRMPLSARTVSLSLAAGLWD